MYPLTDLGHLKRVRCLKTGKGKLTHSSEFRVRFICAEQFSSLCYEEIEFRVKHEKMFLEREGTTYSLKL